MGGAVKPIRVRRSRWPTTCPECAGPISPPELIASKRSPEGRAGPWVHASHVIDEQRAERAAEGAAASG